MTDNEIIKALLCHESWSNGCDSCPLTMGKACGMVLARGALDLINRQKAEIERMKQTPKCIYAYDGETMEYCVEGPCSDEKTVESIKSEAIKEFAERLKEKSSNYCLGVDGVCTMVDVHDIDDIVKEMTNRSEIE